MKIARLTNDGQSGAVAISADGRYVVYSSGSESERSLWVRQAATGSAVQIVAPASGRFSGTTFSPDGDHIFYAWTSAQNPKGSLYEIPVLGGTPRQILADIAGPVSFSPDGRRMVFVRGEAILVVANTDGTNEQVIYSARPETEWFAQEGGAWSPDGRVIVIGKGTSVGGLSMNLFEIDAAGGGLRPLTQNVWKGEIRRSVWLKDGSGLVVTASESFVSGTHVWFVSYPGSAVRRITNDLNGYGTFSLGVTDDGSTIATVLEERRQQIWAAAPGDDDGKAQRLTAEKMDGQPAVLPDGRIVFVRNIGDQQDLWIMNADGSAQRQLTKDARLDFEPIITPDGRYIVWTTDRSGLPHIWRMNVDGTDARALSTGDTFDDGNATVTPDGKWVIYNSWRTGKWAPWKVSIDGGEPQLLLDAFAGVASVAPDGQTYLASYLDEQKQPAAMRAALLPINGGGPVKMFDVALPSTYASGGTSWSPDGRTVFYFQDRNVMSMNVADGKIRAATNFKTETIFNMAASSDGKRFLLSRGEVINDVVLIKDFR
jgi:Tol biopolymer transport system component